MGAETITLVVCDGCRVRRVCEHRCDIGPTITVRGETIDHNCECPWCAHQPTDEELAAFMKEIGADD